MSGNIDRIHIVVTGLVQGVSYRASTRDEAETLGLVGWVRNLPDGSVECVAEGTADAVGRLELWCRTGPRGARVEAVKVLARETIPAPSFARFDIRR